MKALVLFSSIACLFLFSCKKDHQNNTTKPKMYQVSYSVTSFSQDIGPIINATGQKNNSLAVNASLKDSVDRLYFALYNTSNNKSDFITQNSSDPNFGTFRDSVPAGAYIVSFIGVKGPTDYGYLNPTPRNPSDATWSPLTFSFYPPEEIFMKTFALNVSAPTSTQHVVLDRIVGLLQINITDALPYNAASVKVVIPTETGGGVFSTYQKTITAADRATTPYQLSFFNLRSGAPFTLTLNFYDAQNVLVLTKNIPNVTCKPNTKTILTGKIAPVTNSQFQITLSSDWGSPISKPF